MSETSGFPSISLVTPSYNQGAFLEATVRSVLNQKYPSLEYVVMDGGSTDDSVSIIRTYADRLSSWSSEKDGGQYDAINKGFARTSGEVMGWLNSDDLHTPWTLSVVGEIFAQFPQIEWLTTTFPIRWDARGRAVSCTDRRGFSSASIRSGDTYPGVKGCVIGPIQQESTFWRRTLWEKAGGALDADLDAAADFDLWMRFAKHAEPVAVRTPLAGFRIHGAQKTSVALEKYQNQAQLAFVKNGGRASHSKAYLSLRHLCRDRLPMALQPLAARLGYSFKASVCQRSKDNSRWEIRKVWI